MVYTFKWLENAYELSLVLMNNETSSSLLSPEDPLCPFIFGVDRFSD